MIVALAEVFAVFAEALVALAEAFVVLAEAFAVLAQAFVVSTEAFHPFACCTVFVLNLSVGLGVRCSEMAGQLLSSPCASLT